MDVLRGLTSNPTLTGFARGLLEAVAFLVIYSVADFALTLPEMQMWVPLIWTVIRTSEGYVDRIDPAKQRAKGD